VSAALLSRIRYCILIQTLIDRSDRLSDADGQANTPGTYVAVDGMGKSYFLVACSIDNRQTKMFLVDNVGIGLNALQTEEAQYTVTGGPTSGCAVVLLQSVGFAGV
jgi:hypothetical protein